MHIGKLKPLRTELRALHKMSLSNIFQTSKAQMFSECKISIALTTNIHLLIYHIFTCLPKAISFMGKQKVLTKSQKYFTAHFNCLLLQQMLGQNNLISSSSVQLRYKARWHKMWLILYSLYTTYMTRTYYTVNTDGLF